MVLLPQIPLGEEKVVTTSLTSVLNFLVNKYLMFKYSVEKEFLIRLSRKVGCDRVEKGPGRGAELAAVWRANTGRPVNRRLVNHG